MKLLALLQVVLGGITTFAAKSLAEEKAHVLNPSPVPGGGFWTDSPPPNRIFEFVLLFLGLAILTCGYFQRRKQAKGSAIQIINGLVISIVSGFLAIRAMARSYGEVSAVYYLAYIPLLIGLVVLVVGIRQLTHAIDLRK
jgi:hypothetical protein